MHRARHRLQSDVVLETTVLVNRMMMKRPLLLLLLLQLVLENQALRHSNSYYYQDLSPDGKGNEEIYFSGVRLHVESPQTMVSAVQGGNVTLPCVYRYEPEVSSPRRTRVKWLWQPNTGETKELHVMVAFGSRHRSYGDFQGRVRLRRSAPGDASLVIDQLQNDDTGRYRCEIIDGLEDESITVELQFRGVVFPYYSPVGRYQFNFQEAKEACEQQAACLATFEQLYEAWDEEKLDWCNAGWLADGTAQYPVSVPRDACGGTEMAPGVRSYGMRDKSIDRFDVFCFTSSIRGEVYFLQHKLRLNFSEAVEECAQDGAQIAKVGQLYAAWRFAGLDQCDAGWVADGSVRYPITKPRANCGPLEPGVRSFGFLPHHLKFGVYCHKVRW
ncbi:Hyaluronan and proteoglycan link protein 3 [Bagarius yarrelli]|uniref:Hyaluronan and proteoglycan link protein 3 n=1 Tax=Bagarius yarrelli TaxID=175774 RepID=A0A556TNK8_BAGYA|nr:Hyaluronan and proteoglycan link protein 3 [Bagarius yarrelli]